MRNKEELIGRILGLLFPEQRKWIVRVLVLAGLSMVSAPLWEPYLKALLAKYLDISVPSSNATIGYILLALGLLGAIGNVILDLEEKRVKVSAKDAADKGALQRLFSELHLPTLDMFIEYGKTSIIYMPVLHYFSGLDAVVRSSTFNLHDQRLKEEVEHFHASLSKALSYGEYFVEMPNDKLQKFDSRRDVHADPDARAAHDGFTKAVWDTEAQLKALSKDVCSKFPEFDFDATSARALADYKSYYEEVARRVSDWEFSVMSAIIAIEEIREIPNLEKLSAALQRPSVDVRVALDKLIELGYVKHLYPGVPWQKYTVLADGRAFYVQHRDSDSQE